MKLLFGVLIFAAGAFAQTAVYPGGVVTDSQLAVAANGISTTLLSSMTVGDTSMSVVSSTGIVPNMLLTIGTAVGSKEIVMVCSVVGKTVNIGKVTCPSLNGRGFDNSVITVHATGTPVQALIDAWHHNAVTAEIKAIEANVTGPYLNLTAYGAKCDGATDDTAALNSAIVAAMTTTGLLQIPYSVNGCLINSQIVLPNNGASPLPAQHHLKIVGTVPDMSYSSGGAPLAGKATLDMRYQGATAKLVTLGFGTLMIDGVNFKDGGSTNSTPFIFTTNTTLKVSNDSFTGTCAVPAACTQDAIVLGGSGTTVGNTTTNFFQGYGTVIRDSYFDKIQRLALLQNAANNIVIRDNVVSNACGGADVVELTGTAGYSPNGALIEGNTFETTYYVYGVKLLSYSARNTISFNGFWDSISGTTLAYVYFGPNSRYNQYYPGYQLTSATISSVDDQSGLNNYWGYNQSATEWTKDQPFLSLSEILAINPGSSSYGDRIWCSTCLATNPCSGGSFSSTSGALALWNGAQWNCGGPASLALGAFPGGTQAGQQIYCTNCTTAATCTTGGSGHMAVYNGSNWACD